MPKDKVLPGTLQAVPAKARRTYRCGLPTARS
jgi:hypothetical protein